MNTQPDRLQKGTRALERAVRRPRWFMENLRLHRDRRRDERRRFSLDDYPEFTVTEVQAAEGALGLSPERYEEALARIWKPERDGDFDPMGLNARHELMNLVGVLVHELKPSVVVETGVAAGFTTATILGAMSDNAHGHLYSVDLPPIGAEQESVGRIVPQHVRERWTLEIGPSRRVLAGLVERVAPLDLAIHDADHTYQSQLDEYATTWPRLRSGGFLISDDVGNPAFVEFAAEVGVRPFLVVGATASAVGIARKP